MSTRPPLSPEVRALLDRERIIPAVSAAQRARALARARASLATPPAASNAPAGAAPRRHWVAAAAAALVLSAAVGAAAYEIHARMAPAPARRPAAAAPVREVVASAPAPSAPAPVARLVPPQLPAAEAPNLSPAEAARAELRLLRQARVAVARGDFAAALPPIAEHARRFKNGRLAEEREALRVRTLAGLGRTEEARHAAAAFRARFPRSVLLPAVSQMPASGP